MCTDQHGYDEAGLQAALAGRRRLARLRAAAFLDPAASDTDREVTLQALRDDLRVGVNGQICAALAELLPDGGKLINQLELAIESHAARRFFRAERPPAPPGQESWRIHPTFD